MRRLTIAGWIGALSVIATAMGLFMSIAKQVGAKPDNAGLMKREAEPNATGQNVREHESAPRRDADPSPSDGDTHVRRASLRPTVPEALPFPPLPTRYWPGPPPTSDHSMVTDQGDALPMPPVPSKFPPGPAPEAALFPDGVFDGEDHERNE